MNHMKEVAQLLGVEIGEEFKVVHICDDSIGTNYKVTEENLEFYSNGKWYAVPATLVNLLNGQDKVVKIPKPVLDDVEKEYLSYVIKPFKGRIKYLYKYSRDDYYEEIAAKMIDCGHLILPPFDKNTMYKGMELNKDYSLEELGL